MTYGKYHKWRCDWLSYPLHHTSHTKKIRFLKGMYSIFNLKRFLYPEYFKNHIWMTQGKRYFIYTMRGFFLKAVQSKTNTMEQINIFSYIFVNFFFIIYLLFTILHFHRIYNSLLLQSIIIFILNISLIFFKHKISQGNKQIRNWIGKNFPDKVQD